MVTSLKERLLKSSRSFIIGVAGDSGSGKTTFVKGIRSILGDDLVSGFSTDDYHKEDREKRKTTGILPLDPNANYLDLYAEHLERVKKGQNLKKPVYSHTTGRINPNTTFKPTPIVIVEGLHPYYLKKTKNMTDFKIFVDPSRRVKYAWKIKRDVEKRGADPEKIKKEMMAREPLYRQYVDPQKLSADIVVEIRPTKFYVNPVLQLEEMRVRRREKYRVRLIQQLVDYPIDPAHFSVDLTKMLDGAQRPFHFEYYQDIYYGRKVTVTTIDGEIHYKTMEPLESHILDHIGRKETTFTSPKYDEYMNSVDVAQILICWRFIERLDMLLKE
ncbi:phosphoribulokinase [[Eubacterium] cellulosolvens]